MHLSGDSQTFLGQLTVIAAERLEDKLGQLSLLSAKITDNFYFFISLN